MKIARNKPLFLSSPGRSLPKYKKRAQIEKIKKRALEKRAPENCHRLQCKSLFNVADLVNGM